MIDIVWILLRKNIVENPTEIIGGISNSNWAKSRWEFQKTLVRNSGKILKNRLEYLEEFLHKFPEEIQGIILKVMRRTPRLILRGFPIQILAGETPEAILEQIAEGVSVKIPWRIKGLMTQEILRGMLEERLL